jgi:hypothetical protein
LKARGHSNKNSRKKNLNNHRENRVFMQYYPKRIELISSTLGIFLSKGTKLL